MVFKFVTSDFILKIVSKYLGCVPLLTHISVWWSPNDKIYEQRVRTYRIKNKPVPERLKYTYRSAVLQKLINNKLLDQYMQKINII